MARARYPSSSGNVFSERTISRASRSVRGVIRTETSRISSAAVPPAPQASTGPKLWSFTTPTISSTPAGAIGCTIRPSKSITGRSNRLLHLLRRDLHGRCSLQAEPHPSGVAFVQKAARARLQRDGHAELGGYRRCLGCHRLQLESVSAAARSSRAGQTKPSERRQKKVGELFSTSLALTREPWRRLRDDFTDAKVAEGKALFLTH